MRAQAVQKPDPTVGPASPKPSIQSHLLRVARASGSPQGFLSQALARTAAEFASPYALIYARTASAVMQDEVHRGPTAPTFWRGAVQQFMSDALAAGGPRAKLLSARRAEFRVALLFAPLRDEACGIEGGIALVVSADAERARLGLSKLENIGGLIASSFALVGTERAARHSGSLPDQAISRAASMSSLEELAFAITNGIRNRLAAEQVALGLVRGSRVRIVAISGLDDVNQRSPGVATMRAAMEECLDAGEPIVCQRERAWGGSAARWQLHEQWRASTGGDAVLSIPLRSGEACTAVLSLRRRDDEPLRAEQVDEIRGLVEPFAPALELVRQARRGMFAHARDALRGVLKATFSRGQRGRKLLIGLALAAAAWFALGTLNHELRVSAVVAPATSRHVAMPFEGVLGEVRVVPGDVVRAGDVLATLDRRDLELERARLKAQLNVLETERTRALADKNPVEARLAEANQRLAQTQLAIVERRLEQAEIRAPFAGVVIRGDLRKQVGEVLPLGQSLFEVAPLDAWLLELELPEALVAEVAAGQIGEFAGAARPGDVQGFTVSRIAPSAEARGGRNVYVVEARLSQPADWLRPGVEGTARVHVGPRRVWWIVCHRALDALRLNFWL